MQSRMLRRWALAAILGIGAGVCVVSRAEARPSRPNPQASRRGFDLFQGAKTVLMNVNRIQCDLIDRGKVCNNPLGGGSLEDGIWPKGSADTYIYNGGLQLAGTVTSATPFKWVGDTVGVFFMDPRGDQEMGEGLTNMFSSNIQDDLNNWPDDALIRDPTLYDASLLGRQFISQQDAWIRYWDGNPNLGSGRKHPMGVMVEQRALAWNFPSGNEDVMYVLFRFVNVTASDPTVYDTSSSLIAAGYTAGQRSDIAALGARFATAMNQLYNITIPPQGFTFHNMFADFFQDADVAGAVDNYSTTSLPFAMSYAYESDWLGLPGWSFPPDIFGAPFTAVTGLEGVKYLKSPVNPATGQEFGISLFSNTINAATGFPDPVGVSKLYRYMSGTVSPALGDNACTSANPVTQRYCAAVQSPQDTRFFMSSGPFDMSPGQTSVIVVAVLFAAPVASLPAVTGGPVALPAFSLAPFIGELPGMVPGFPTLPSRLALGQDTVRTIERVAGWQAYSDKNGDGSIEQNEVTTVPRSLLNKSLVAQAVFDSKFLLPFAPEAPQFYLVPGDGQVTVVWKKSPTEDPLTGGDPYFKVSSDVTNALYDPNYRKFDVEGYRIWRGRTGSTMKVIAQFDYPGTVFPDNNGLVWTDAYGNQCAPELGLTLSCPAFPNPVDLISPFIQFKRGDRAVLSPGDFTDTTAASRTVSWIHADTAVTGGATGFPALADNGVPFGFVDNTVQNGFTYFYAVTAFDVNSAASGPTSLQSGLVPRSVTPRLGTGQETAGSVGAVQLIGGDGKPLDVSAPVPTIDAATGIFSGPFPPTDAMPLSLAAFVPQVLGTGALTVTIDSVVPGDAWDGLSGAYWITAQGSAAATKLSIPYLSDIQTLDATNNVVFPAFFGVQGKSTRFGGDSTYAFYGNVTVTVPGSWYLTSYGRCAANGRAFGCPGNATEDFNGPRWWAGAANENTPNPNGGNCATAAAGCTAPNVNLTAGSLPNVTGLWGPIAYTNVPSNPLRAVEALMSQVARAADFRVYWGGTAGKVDSVVDVTHHVKVPFSPIIRASWGILNDSSFAAVPAGVTPDGDNTLLTWSDFMCVAPAPVVVDAGTASNSCGAGADSAVLMDHARLSNIYVAASAYGATGAATGTGFIFYLAGHYFLMQMAALPQNTVWNMRSYAGFIRGAAATSNLRFVAAPERPAAIPGLRLQIQTEGSVVDSVTRTDLLARVHTVPDPYYVTNALETVQNSKVLQFVNLPSRAMIRIYSASGILIRIITHNDPMEGGVQTWDLRNRNNQFVASGVYFFHVETPDGRTKIGRFTVVNFAQ